VILPFWRRRSAGQRICREACWEKQQLKRRIVGASTVRRAREVGFASSLASGLAVFSSSRGTRGGASADEVQRKKRRGG